MNGPSSTTHNKIIQRLDPVGEHPKPYELRPENSLTGGIASEGNVYIKPDLLWRGANDEAVGQTIPDDYHRSEYTERPTMSSARSQNPTAKSTAVGTIRDYPGGAWWQGAYR